MAKGKPMNGRNQREFLLAILIVANASAQQPVMRAHFVPVGQAHATLLEFSCGAMLIDAGAQDEETKGQLLDYLDRFFVNRPDLHRTLDLILITHNHIDHTYGLRGIAEHNIRIKTYVDSGQRSGRGTEGPNWIRANARSGGRNIKLREVTVAEITAQASAHHTGLTDSAIDPIACGSEDPQISVLWGRLDKRPAGWSKSAFENKNNHSLVTRVRFGSASFLFMGDLEPEGISSLLELFPGNGSVLDADVYQVGHHGSDNATTEPLLRAVTPRIAIIPVGNWDSGKGTRDRFTTFAYGHPRKAAIDLLNAAIKESRSEPATVMAATGPRTFSPLLVRKRIYATSWDGAVTVRATSDAQYRVTRE